jgi:hypothetical protein
MDKLRLCKIVYYNKNKLDETIFTTKVIDIYKKIDDLEKIRMICDIHNYTDYVNKLTEIELSNIIGELLYLFEVNILEDIAHLINLNIEQLQVLVNIITTNK